jgi:hypothetical protein
MHPDLDRALCERYPKLFARRQDPTSCMSEGFACREGWYHLLDGLCSQLQRDTDQLGAPQLIVTQVKQKFGTLRFYVRPAATRRQQGMIELAYTLSGRICEICGAPAQWRGAEEAARGGLIATRCDAHREAPP